MTTPPRLADLRLAAIQRLTKRELDAYRLAETGRLTHHQIAIVLGVTPSAIHHRLQRAAKKLANHSNEGDTA